MYQSINPSEKIMTMWVKKESTSLNPPLQSRFNTNFYRVVIMCVPITLLNSLCKLSNLILRGTKEISTIIIHIFK